MDNEITNFSVVRAEKIEIVDKNGKPVIRLGCTDEGKPELELIDASDSCARIRFEVLDERVSVGFLSKDGSTLLGIGYDAKNGGGITIANAECSRMAMLSFHPDTDDFITFAESTKPETE